MSRAIFIFAVLLSHISYAQSGFNGKVLDRSNEKPIPFASISVEGTSAGTASDEDGVFYLSVSNKMNGRILVACLGYKTSSFSIDSLKLIKGDLKLYLVPMVNVLQEIVVAGKVVSAEVLLKEAIAAIPVNYNKNPFNLEFYSIQKVTDSIKPLYMVETEILTYRNGYTKGAMNISKIIQKRVTGESPISNIKDKKTKKNYFPYWPAFYITLSDNVGIDQGYSVFNADFRKRLNYENGGITYFDKDTVCIINYWIGSETKRKTSRGGVAKYDGTILVAINNLAIIRHALKIGNINVDIIYKRYNDKYYPYLIQSKFIHQEGDKKYWIDQTVALENIVIGTAVKVLENMPENWHPEDVEYNALFWEGRSRN